MRINTSGTYFARNDDHDGVAAALDESGGHLQADCKREATGMDRECRNGRFR
jgi:hypothetical protein